MEFKSEKLSLEEIFLKVNMYPQAIQRFYKTKKQVTSTRLQEWYSLSFNTAINFIATINNYKSIRIYF